MELKFNAKVELDFEDVKRLVRKSVEDQMPGFVVDDMAFKVSKKRIGGSSGQRGTKGSYEIVVVEKVEVSLKQCNEHDGRGPG